MVVILGLVPRIYFPLCNHCRSSKIGAILQRQPEVSADPRDKPEDEDDGAIFLPKQKCFHSGETRFRIARRLRANDKNNGIST
jgi:hypothetical protein